MTPRHVEAILPANAPGSKKLRELDSYRYHASRHASEQDRRREREAYARGDEFRRSTYGDVFERWDTIRAELTTRLARSTTI